SRHSATAPRSHASHAFWAPHVRLAGQSATLPAADRVRQGASVLANHNPPLAADENDHTHSQTDVPRRCRATLCADAIASSSHARTPSGGGERPVCAPSRNAKRTNSAR